MGTLILTSLLYCYWVGSLDFNFLDPPHISFLPAKRLKLFAGDLQHPSLLKDLVISWTFQPAEALGGAEQKRLLPAFEDARAKAGENQVASGNQRCPFPVLRQWLPWFPTMRPKIEHAFEVLREGLQNYVICLG